MNREEILEMQYIGVLNFLCEHAVHLRNIEESNETITHILDDAQKLIPTLRWKQILDRFEISFVRP